MTRHPLTLIPDVLLQDGRLSQQAYEVLRAEEKISGRPLHGLLLEMGILKEDELATLMAELWQCSIVDLEDFAHEIPKVYDWIPHDILESTVAIPIQYDVIQSTLSVAIGDISNASAKELIRDNIKRPVQIVFEVAAGSKILKKLRSLGPLAQVGTNQHKNIQNHVVHQFLYEILNDSVEKGASDIHFEPEKFSLRVRYRCDGLMHTAQTFHISFWHSLCVQLKVLASMDIAESRRPQDGRFSLSVFGRSIDFRVSCHPTLHGENIVLRILDQEKTLISLENLGYGPEQLTQIYSLVQRPEGMVILTGPTGSGKTTSLYSMISILDKERLNIMTLEEPIECHLPGIRQSEVRDSNLLSFSSGVHSILRQDPDVILIGEIRDEKTADMALRASMTGHLVFTTLHTTHALGALYRLKELNVNPSLLSGIINGIVAQRLIRLLCPQCKISHVLEEMRAQEFGLWPQKHVWQASDFGCEMCHFSGYKGRATLAEILVMNHWIEEMFLNQAPYEEIHRVMAHHGFQDLRRKGIEAVLSGKTSIAEIQRVIGGFHGTI